MKRKLSIICSIMLIITLLVACGAPAGGGGAAGGGDAPAAGGAAAVEEIEIRAGWWGDTVRNDLYFARSYRQARNDFFIFGLYTNRRTCLQTS